MSLDELLLVAMIASAIAGGAMALAHVVGVFVYDASEVRRQRELRAHPHVRALRQRPLVTVLVSALNSAPTIEQTLDSILRNTYRKVEIIVVDHSSLDETRSVVRRYAALHSNRSIRLVARRLEYDREVALTRALRQHGHGQLVVALPAGGVFDKLALTRMVQHFAYNPDANAYKLNEHVSSSLSVIGLFEKYQALLGRRVDKALDAVGLLPAAGRAAAYRADTFASRSHKHLRIHYAHDVMIAIPALASLAEVVKRSYRYHSQVILAGVAREQRDKEFWLRMGYSFCSAVVSLCAPLLIAYFLYIALYLHEPTLLLLAVAALSAFLLLAIGEGGRLKPRQKAAYVLGIPMTFCLFYILSLSRTASVISLPLAKRIAD